MYYARKTKDKRLQELSVHLSNVAKMMADLIQNSSPELIDVAYNIGLLHDLGKYSPGWQKYLLEGDRSNRGNHALHGALCLYDHYQGHLGIVIAAIAYGHHRGLLKGFSGFQQQKNSLIVFRSELLCERDSDLDNRTNSLNLLNGELQSKDAGLRPPTIPAFFLKKENNEYHDMPLNLQFMMRLLFATLIHCDRLDAQNFEHGIKKPQTKTIKPQFPEFLSPSTPINTLRNDFLRMCELAGNTIDKNRVYQIPGITGIGKTISILRLALLVVERYPEYRGAVYVGPLKAVIEQTGQVWQNILGQDNVLIHYSDNDLTTESDHRQYEQDSEQWDVDYIVTTAVQFFESIYSNRPRKCRKLANLANRVIIIDEVQTIPEDLLKFCLYALEMVACQWNCTVLLVSATHPSYKSFKDTDYINPLENLEDYKTFEDNCRSLVSSKPWSYCTVQNKKEFWEAIATKILSSGHSHSLTIVNTVKDAEEGLDILSKLVDGDWVCLTAKNCPAERKDIYKTLPTCPEDWKYGSKHVICTPLLNTGVDLDFPLVIRAIAGVDELLQALGRFNRSFSGKASEFVVIDCLHIEGDYLNRYKISEARKSIKECDGDIYKAVETYYERLADWVRTNSGKDLNKAKDSLDFDYINDNFKMIQDSYKVAVLVPYKYGAKLIEKYWDATELTSSDWRSIQPYLGMYSKSEIEKDISIVWRECGVYMREPWQDD